MRNWIPGLMLAVRMMAVEPVTLIPPEGEYWCGEPIPVAVELRGQGTFKGSPSFSIPEMPRTQWLRRGNPVLSSERAEGGEVFVQRHYFSLITQLDGAVEVPNTPVTFGLELGGTHREVGGEVPAFTVQVKRPPGVAAGVYVVSTSGYQVTQTWSQMPEKVEAGTVLIRTVVQTADGLSGMSLPPLPLEAPSGVRVYPPRVDVDDRENRGDLTGTRTEEVRYRFEQAGTVTLPSVVYRAWDPDRGSLEEVRLEGVEVNVKGAPGSGGPHGVPWGIVTGGGVLLSLLWVLRTRRIPNPLPPRVHLPPLNS